MIYTLLTWTPVPAANQSVTSHPDGTVSVTVPASAGFRFFRLAVTRIVCGRKSPLSDEVRPPHHRRRAAILQSATTGALMIAAFVRFAISDSTDLPAHVCLLGLLCFAGFAAANEEARPGQSAKESGSGIPAR